VVTDETQKTPLTTGASRTPRRVCAWVRRRPTVMAAIVYAVLSLLMFCQALAPGRVLSTSDYLWSGTPWNSTAAPAGVPGLGSNRDEADSAVLFEPFLQTTRATLPHVPLWNPYIMGGRPYLADAQSAVFSPFNVPGYVLPFWRSLAVIAALKLFAAALGAYLLGRGLGMRFAGALMAGLVFGFSLWMVTWVSWPTTSVWAFLPWLCLMSERVARGRGPLAAVGLAGIVSLQYFAGHPESSFDVIVFTVVFWVYRAIGHRPPTWRAVAHRALMFGSALAAGTALAAGVLIPFFELLSHSSDLASRGPVHTPARYLLGVFLHDYWGRQTTTRLESAHALEEHAFYIGALTLMLAAGALLLRPRRERVVMALLGGGALAVAVNIPAFNIVTRLPGFSTAQNSRLAVIYVLGAALLAGWGLDDLTSPGVFVRSRARALFGICVALLTFPLIVMAIGGTLSLGALGSAMRIAWGFAKPPLLSFHAGPTSLAHLVELIRTASLLEWLLPASAAVALVSLRLRGRLGGPAFAAAAVLLVAADLFRAGVGYTPAIPIRHAVQPVTSAIRYLQSQRPARFVGIGPLSLGSFVPPLTPDLAMRYGLYDARGYDYPVEARYEQLWRYNIATSPNCYYAFCHQTVAGTPRALRALGLLGVTNMLEAPRDPPLGLRVAYSGSDARIYINPYALPRAFLVEHQSVVPGGPAALATITSRGFPARVVAVTDRQLPGLPTAHVPSTAPPGQARMLAYHPEQVIVQTSSQRSALLVLTDEYFPGWNATVDGRATPIHRVDYLLRGVSVPAGAHRVEFRYEPVSWRIGWIVSSLAVLVLTASALFGWRVGRRPGRVGP